MVEHGGERTQVHLVALGSEQVVQPLGRHHAAYLRAQYAQRPLGPAVHIGRKRFAQQVYEHRFDGNIARHVPRFAQHRIQHERMPEYAMEQAVHDVAHHFVRGKLETIDHKYRVIHHAYAVGRYAVYVEARLERHTPKRPVQKAETHGKRGAGLFQNVVGDGHALFVTFAFLLHLLFGEQGKSLGISVVPETHRRNFVAALEHHILLIDWSKVLHNNPYKLKSRPTGCDGA